MLKFIKILSIIANTCSFIAFCVIYIPAMKDFYNGFIHDQSLGSIYIALAVLFFAGIVGIIISELFLDTEEHPIITVIYCVISTIAFIILIVGAIRFVNTVNYLNSLDELTLGEGFAIILLFIHTVIGFKCYSSATSILSAISAESVGVGVIAVISLIFNIIFEVTSLASKIFLDDTLIIVYLVIGYIVLTITIIISIPSYLESL